MKIHIGKEFPRALSGRPTRGSLSCSTTLRRRRAFPTCCSPSPPGRKTASPTCAFTGGAAFTGTKPPFFAVMGNLYQHTHTYPEHPAGGVLLRQLPAHRPLRQPGGDHPPERPAKPTSSPPGASPLARAHTIHAPAIRGGVSSPWSAPSTATQDLSGAGVTAMVVGQVQHSSLWRRSYARGYGRRYGQRRLYAAGARAPETLLTGAPGQPGIATAARGKAGLNSIRVCFYMDL